MRFSVVPRQHLAFASQRPEAAGLNLFNFVGPTPPGGTDGWKFEGGTGKTFTEVEFDASVAPGSRVWFSAFWFNPRKQAGPASAPVGANIPGGGTSLLAA